MPPSKSSFGFSATPVALFAHLLGITITILVLVWNLHFRGGMALRSHNKQLIFNVHPVLMLIGLVFIGGEAIMSYKTVPVEKKRQKYVHMVLHLIALLVGIVGVYAVFKYHREAGFKDMLTLHSWLGMGTICLFGLQWLLGFLSFLYPGVASSRRTRAVPWHVFAGMAVFLMAICTAESGLVEKFIFLQLKRGKESYLINFMGLIVLLFGIAVSLCTVLPRS